jgi:transcriptional regulator
MYNPQRFKANDISEAFDLMDQHPFATVISISGNMPFVSHLPLTPKKQGDQIELIGHLAKANPHSKLLSKAHTIAVFNGPQTYITPMWYAENNVPTWNYSTVHATGPITLIEDYEPLVDCLQLLTAHAERHWPSGWDFFVPDDLAEDKLTKNIVGFRMTVNSINFKKKLSQSSSPANRAGVLRGLESRQDEASQRVLADMLRLYSKNGELK